MAATPYPAFLCRVAATPYPAYFMPGGGYALPGLRRMAAAPYPAYSPKSPLAQGLLKLPVLAASTSLRRSRKAGAARMDAG
ncbi:hypothetical protein ACV6B8_04810 [Klebsiella pneumoniae subsp. pneumoniae]